MTREAEFDRLFDAILEGKASSAAPSGTGAHSSSSGALSLDDPERKISAAVALFHRGEYMQCLALLRDSQPELSGDPRVAAFLGACRALVMGEMRQGMEACVQAVKKAFYIPDLYCALGVVLLRGGSGQRPTPPFRVGFASTRDTPP